MVEFVIAKKWYINNKNNWYGRKDEANTQHAILYMSTDFILL